MNLDLPKKRNAVRRKMRIAGNNSHSLDNGLRNNQPIKRITVMPRQIEQFAVMTKILRKRSETICFQSSWEQLLIRHRQPEFAQAHFNRDFPRSRVAYPLFVI